MGHPLILFILVIKSSYLQSMETNLKSLEGAMS